MEELCSLLSWRRDGYFAKWFLPPIPRRAANNFTRKRSIEYRELIRLNTLESPESALSNRAAASTSKQRSKVFVEPVVEHQIHPLHRHLHTGLTIQLSGISIQRKAWDKILGDQNPKHLDCSACFFGNSAPRSLDFAFRLSMHISAALQCFSKVRKPPVQWNSAQYWSRYNSRPLVSWAGLVLSGPG